MRHIALAGVVSLVAVAALAGLALAANPGDVVINEIYVNPSTYFDGSEFIELYNTTASAINLAGWTLAGTEYDQVCGGEHRWVFPTGASIAAHGYLVVARDDTTGDVPDDGFKTTFGFHADYEIKDADRTYDLDHPLAPNLIDMNPEASYDNQIRLWPGSSDYGVKCGAYTQYEALYLYQDSLKTVLIDAMEYMNPDSCAADRCTGVNGVDNDAYPGYPATNLSLGRDATGTDTNRSNADFFVEIPTPKAQNVQNAPPDMWTLRYSPCVPTATDSVEISIYVTDPDGIAYVKCYYSVNGGGYTSVTMTAAVGDSLYKKKLPPKADGSQITFYCEARDNHAVPATAYYPMGGAASAYRYAVGVTLISDVQYVDIGGDSSSYTGKAVNITGIVTAGRGVYNDYTFVIQDGAGAWNGIWVYDPTGAVPAEEGDSVVVSGKVSEYFLRTELYMFVGCYNEIDAGHTLPDPAVVSTTTLATTSTLAERYEGVLVKVQNVTVTNDSLGYGEWEINDGSGACRVDDYGYYYYVPNTGDVLDGVQGIVDYSYSDYKIEPRWSEDIIGPPMIFDLVYAPHAPMATDQVTFSVTVTGANPPFTVKLFYSTNGGASFDSVAMSTSDSVYTVVRGPWASGTSIDYYVRATDSQPMSSRKPGAGTYDFYVGRLTIHDVQYVAAGDSSTYAGKPVNVSGIVTAASGEFSDFFFYIQNHYGLAPDFKGVKVYDRTGTVSVQRGDSVTVSGDVWEYYLNTEIAMFFPEAITVHSHGNNVPAPFSVTTASVNTSEKYEGVLVTALNSVVKSAADAYGEWLISNGTAADTCKVGDAGTYAYTPVVNDAVIVTGIVDYAYSRYMIQPRDDDDICGPNEASIEDRPVPSRLALAVRPNPMLDGGQVRFALPVSGNVDLKIYNVKGEVVKTLASGRTEAGEYTMEWNGTNGRGVRVTSGIYFLRLETQAGSAATKVVVSR